jgi:uncharacterized OsmC-like protein
MNTKSQVTGDTTPGTVVVRETGRGQFQQDVISGPHRLLADEPASVGGLDSGPGPYEFLLAALGACTSMTLGLYADRKQFPLVRTQVRLRHERIYAADCAECTTKSGMIDRIERAITFEGDLDAEQRAELMEIADKCPVHRTLKSEVNIRTVSTRSNQFRRNAAFPASRAGRRERAPRSGRRRRTIAAARHPPSAPKATASTAGRP